LTPDHFAIELGERRRPVAIHWNYLGRKPTNGALRSGGHVLMVTGFNEQTHELRIWDPWPAPTSPDPIPSAHEKWIPFELYLDPQSDQGMDAVAVHELDNYKMRRVGEKAPAARTYPPLMDLSRGGPVRPNHVKFDCGLCDLSTEIGEFLDRHVVRKSGREGHPWSLPGRHSLSDRFGCSGGSVERGGGTGRAAEAGDLGGGRPRAEGWRDHRFLPVAARKEQGLATGRLLEQSNCLDPEQDPQQVQRDTVGAGLLPCIDA
jgi:hypothetical protein